MFRLIQREEKYFELFREMASRIDSAANTLKTLFDNMSDAARLADELYKIEHECDDISHQVLRRLNKSFVTPIDREDIYALINALDTVVDLIEETSARVIIYGLTESTPAMRELASLLKNAAAATSHAVSNISDDGDVEGSLAEVHRLEGESDAVFRKAMRELFAANNDPIEVMKRKDMYERLEAAIDACEEAANVIENIKLKND
jgi:predicted phosphate transport protein (TIGR00153 family)